MIMSSIKNISTAENLQVLYEDNHIIAVNKRASDIVQGDKTADKPLSEVVKDYLKVKYNKPGDVFLGVVHRIDRPVSGVLVFARTSKALARLNEQFKKREVEKVYWACVKNEPPQTEAVLSDLLFKDAGKNKSFVTKKERPGAKPAKLSYRCIGVSKEYFLLEVKPETGRHHQIRVQLAQAGMPIKGDLKYGFTRSNPDGSIHLHARKLMLIHPVQKVPLNITAPVPNDPLWQYFATLSDK